MDVSARMQLFDMKTTYQFQTTPGISMYNMPLYSYQSEMPSPVPGVAPPLTISYYPVYQGFEMPVKFNGIESPLYTTPQSFYNLWPNYVQQFPRIAYGDGGSFYTLNIPFFSNYPTDSPRKYYNNWLIPGHLDITGVINCLQNTPLVQDPILITPPGNINLNFSTANVTVGVTISTIGEDGQNIVVTDSGQFLSGNTNSQLYGLLYAPGIYNSGNVVGTYPYGNTALLDAVTEFPTVPYSTTMNTVNYNTGVINVNFPENIPAGTPINVGAYYIEPGCPRSVMFYNNTITMRPPPNTQYLVEMTGYLTPAAFMTTTQSIQFAYMSEYIARGAARKLLSDTGDWEQFNAYEPLFKEQETLVWKRSQRQFTATRTGTIFSNSGSHGNNNNSSLGT